MSTRSNILVEYGATKIYLYKHHDGYLAGTGRAILDHLNAPRFKHSHQGVNTFIASLLTDGEQEFEITSDWHSDIEFAYRVIFADDGSSVKIGVAQRDWKSTTQVWPPREFGKLPTTWVEVCSVKDFEKLVESEEAQIAARLAARKKV